MKHIACIFVALVIGLSSILLICNSKIHQKHIGYNFIDGKVSNDFVRKIKSMRKNDIVTISSTGGSTEPAQEAANYIFINKLNVRIERICASACAEYLLPAAAKIEFVDNPIIAFHGNPIMGAFLEEKYEPEAFFRCYDDTAKQMRELYINAGKNTNFWKEQLRRLKLGEPKFERSERCVRFQYVFEHKFWYPTSDQLQNLLGLRFSGRVCADDFACVRKKIAPRWRKDQSFVVGDNVHFGKRLF